MKVTNVIYLQTCVGCEEPDCTRCNFEKLKSNGSVTWCEDRIDERDKAYFSEEAVRELLRNEFKEVNNIIRFASRELDPVDDDLIEVEPSVESFISKLKGEAK